VYEIKRHFFTRSILFGFALDEASDTISTDGYSGDGETVWRRVGTNVLEAEAKRHHLSAKTCNVERFRTFVAFREASRAVNEVTYGAQSFRALRFQAWSRRDASVKGFAKQITEKFGVRLNQSSVDEAPPVVILYGDWGRRPNLRHQSNFRTSETVRQNCCAFSTVFVIVALRV